MKMVIAIIQPHKLDAVLKALDEKEIYLKTVSNVLGCGRQKGSRRSIGGFARQAICLRRSDWK
jgi:nitrogen regulatory protein PII